VITAVDVVTADITAFGAEEGKKGERMKRDWAVVGATKESKVSFMDAVRACF
jgi:hypothetical protein